MGMSLSARLKFGICDIYFTQNLSMMLCKFYLVRSFEYSWNNNLIMLLRKRNIRFYALKLCFVIEPLSSDIGKVTSMLFSQRWSNADEQTELSFSTKYKRWNNIDLSMLNQRNSFSLVSTFTVKGVLLLPCLKVVRTMLETWNLIPKYIRIWVCREYIF